MRRPVEQRGDQLDLTGADALVLSACVQMPSLASIQAVEDEAGIPVLSAATATTHRVLTELGLEPWCLAPADCSPLLSDRLPVARSGAGSEDPRHL